MKVLSHLAMTYIRRIAVSFTSSSCKQQYQFNIPSHHVSVYDHCSRNLLTSLKSLRISRKQQRWGSAIPILSFSLSIPFFKAKEKEDVIVTLMKDAALAMSHGKWNDADKLYHQALELLSERQKADIICEEEFKLIQAQLLCLLGKLYLEKGDYVVAETVLKDAMRGCLATGLSQDSNAIVELSLKISQVYHYQGKNDLATKGLEFCVREMRAKVESGDDSEDTLALWGLALNCYAQHLVQMNRGAEALKIYGQSLEVAQTLLGPTHEQIGVILSDMSALCIEQNKLDLAEDYIRVAVQNSQAGEQRHLATLLCNFGELRLRQGRYDDAEAVCDRALKLAVQKKQTTVEHAARLCLKDSRTFKAEKKIT